MNQKNNYWFLSIIVLSAILLLIRGMFYQQKIAIKGKLQVLCTTTFIADAVFVIAQDRVAIHCLMGPGVDPHLYRARESDIHILAAADLIFYNGLHLEGKMSEIIAHMDYFDKEIVATSNAVPQNELIFVSENIYDPHIWHNAQLWKKCVLYIGDVLSKADPDNSPIYLKNALDYANKLEQLDSYIRKKVEQIPEKKRILVTAHDAFSYFGKAYGITVVGLQGISTEAQVGTKDIQNLADYIVLHKIPAVFIESSIPARTLTVVEQAVQSRGWHIEWGDQLYSDALGLKSSNADTYEGMMRHNVDAIVKALSK